MQRIRRGHVGDNRGSEPPAELRAPPPELGAPPVWRDPWAWVSVLAVVPLLVRCIGAPLCEPVAEDFDFLRAALLSGNHSLLDGGGSTAFWRPLAHQVYYRALGPLIIAHPGAVAALHAALLALCALLIYRTLRPSWPGRAAALAAGFPLFAESARQLVAWPTQFVDLGLLLFSALAVHEASRRRAWTACASLAAALLCKELAVATALLLPLVPGAHRRGERIRIALGAACVVAVWGAVYLVVRHHAHLELPHGIEHGRGAEGISWLAREAWAFVATLRAVMSQPRLPSPNDGWLSIVLAAIAAGAVVALAINAAARARLRAARGWIVWGVAWFVLYAAPSALMYPFWAPSRNVIGAVGLGIAATATLEAAHPALPLALLAVRIVTLAVSPSAPARVSPEVADRGAFIDFERLSRLQLLMRSVRARLAASYPRMPSGARVCQFNLPLMSEYAFGGDHALSVWYRDSTVHWVRYDAFRAHPELNVTTVIQYQSHRPPSVALVEPEAFRAYHLAAAAIGRRAWQDALTFGARADSLQRDRTAQVFLAMAAAARLNGYAFLDRREEGEREARLALALWPEEPNARYFLAAFLDMRGERGLAIAQLDSQLVIYPEDRESAALLAHMKSGAP